MYFKLKTFINIISLCFLCITATAACSQAEISTNTKKQIAITFDDAPRGNTVLTGQERTAMLIESLRKANVEQAMFFLTTGGINGKTSKRIEAYQAAGHLVANHSHQHLWFNKTDIDEYQEDFLTAHNIIKDYPNFKQLYRFPYLDEGRSREKIDAMRTFLTKQGYENGYVTVDTYDWYMDSLYKNAVKNNLQVDIQKLETLYVDTLIEAVIFYDDMALEYLDRSPKHVLLLHENDLAAMFIDELVIKLRSMGWEIISPEVAFKDPIAKVISKTLFNGQGRVAAIARDLGANPKTLVSKTEDEAYLDKLFNQSGVFSPLK